MGIYGALSTAVSGLRAQSHALENISGNIANSQTTGYKRIETSFIDLIPDAPVKNQVPGAVIAQSRSTNDVRGDIQNASTETFMALNGSGFFVVEPAVNGAGGTTQFAGNSYYTRRGDFDIDKNGYLVNGAGYYLKGLPIDANGAVTGSVPSVIQISNGFLKAEKTQNIDYKLNLPQLPKTASYDAATPGSELMQRAPATASGAVAVEADPASTLITADGQTLDIQVGGVTRSYVLRTDGTPTGYPNIDGSGTLAAMLADIQTDLRANGGPAAAGAVVSAASGRVVVSLDGNTAETLTISGTAGLGLNGTYLPFPGTGNTVSAQHSNEFMNKSITGGGITAYSDTGAPVNVQLRWAKTANTSGAEAWSLYYASDSTATGNNPMWTKLADYTFNADGTLATPNPASVSIADLVVDGLSAGAVTLDHGPNGVTQFADNSGSVKTTTLTQDGNSAGEFISVGINDSGRIVASYTNGQQVEVAQVMVANFNAPNALKRMDGGLFAATSESGEPVLTTNGGIVGSSLEASNTDISEEFTKLIVTQQAYAANTRIVSAADAMLQETLNMVR